MSSFTSRLLAVTMLAVAAVIGVNVSTAPPASAAWEDCGDYVCTQYLTREETRAVAKYLNSVTPFSDAAAKSFCAWTGYRGGGIGAIAGVACAGATARYDWRPAANEAVAHDACFQVAHSRQWWGKFWPSTGWTNHSSYCFD